MPAGRSVLAKTVSMAPEMFDQDGPLMISD
jgi:hypothetical protein